MTDLALQAEGVSFSHTRAPLFEGLDLIVRRGEMAALLGSNGSGKTTLIKLLAGTIRPRAGKVLLEGRPVGSLPPRERARRVAVVPQDTSLAFDFTVMEMVLMGRTPHLGALGLERPEDLDAAREAMRLTGMLPLAGRPLSHLSGGERQLAVIARALAQKPRVLLLDEPTAHLDIRHRIQIAGVLERLNVQEGITIVATSHDINLAARHSRRMILLDAGRVVADGAPSDVMRADLLSEVFRTPLRVERDPLGGAPWAMPDGRPAEPDL
ncbi:MAG: ABC transporter ATP-binding protein [Candidatus Polarisedimenticolia bacterium]